MDHPAPPQVTAAVERLKDAIRAFEGKDVVILNTPWAEIEKSIIKLLGGAFDVSKPEHQLVALGLAGIFAARLIHEHQAFWFPNRDSPEGASVGFPDAVIMLSPFGTVAESLGMARLERLDEVGQQIRRALGQAKFSLGSAQAGLPRLTPADYRRLFDPGFLQFILLDAQKAKTVWEQKPQVLSGDIQRALGKLNKVPQEAKQQFEAQVGAALKQMNPDKALIEQGEDSTHVAELLAHMFATVEATAFAPEEFWAQIAFPLLMIGNPPAFPPMDPEELEAFANGMDPLALFIDVVPHQFSAPEEGLFSVFPVSDVSLLHPAFEQADSVKLLKLKVDAIAPALAQFSPAQTQSAVARFKEYLVQQSGKPAPATPGNEDMLNAALTLLSSFKELVEGVKQGKGDLCFRRVTEAEGTSEALLGQVREALQTPRILLA